MAVIDRVLVGEALVIEERADGNGLDLLNQRKTVINIFISL